MNLELIHNLYQNFVYCVLLVMASTIIVAGFCALYKKTVNKCKSVQKISLAAMLVFSMIATIQAQKRVYVDVSVSKSGDGSIAAPYKQIDDALADLSSKTSRMDIVLAPGVYKPFGMDETPIDANGNPLSISISTYRRDDTEDDSSSEWVIDGSGFLRYAYAAYLPNCDSVTNTITGITVRNSPYGIANFHVNGCVVSNIANTALINCRADKTIICNSRIGLENGVAKACDFTGCTETAVEKSQVEYCYITNNTGIAACGSSVDTCLIAYNDYGVTNSQVLSTSILSNRKGGVLGDTVACNTLIAFNLDGEDRLCNFYGENIFMTNCCTAPMPTCGANNFYSAMPIYPDTYKLPLGSPVFRNGDTNLLIRTTDLNGNNRRKDGVTDIGAFFYSNESATRPKAPKSWWSDRTMQYVDSLIFANFPVMYKEWLDLDEKCSNWIRLKSSYLVKDIIPYSWCYSNSQFYFEYDDIMNFKSGKKACDGSDITWWDEYVMGTDPNVEDDIFRVHITIDANGSPQISWMPNLENERIYLIFGKKELSDEWVYISDGDLSPYRFFKVSVDLP